MLDKPRKLNADEWTAVGRHAGYTHNILARTGPFQELTCVAAPHHDRLDGKGYPNAPLSNAITLESRIITTDDIFDAISADRPYRPGLPLAKTPAIMAHEVGSAIEPLCFEALKSLLLES
ncbi:MAG: HD domain-containing phosphohydrolase [Rhodoferax sp.]